MTNSYTEQYHIFFAVQVISGPLYENVKILKNMLSSEAEVVYHRGCTRQFEVTTPTFS